jgi:hypothetical protein
MLRKLLGFFSLAGVLLSLGALPTTSAASDDVRFPAGFRDWFVVNSMIVTKDIRSPHKSAACTSST